MNKLRHFYNLVFHRRNREVIYPFRAFIRAMKDKDAVLYARISMMHPKEAARRWRLVYPEDFQDGEISVRPKSDPKA